LTHVAAASGQDLLPMRGTTDALRRRETDALDAHEHCGTAFTLQGGSSLPIVGGAARFAPAPQERPAPVSPPARGRVIILASAPKTSPPTVWS
jgi:hypothetical protein